MCFCVCCTHLMLWNDMSSGFRPTAKSKTEFFNLQMGVVPDFVLKVQLVSNVSQYPWQHGVSMDHLAFALQGLDLVNPLQDNSQKFSSRLDFASKEQTASEENREKRAQRCTVVGPHVTKGKGWPCQFDLGSLFMSPILRRCVTSSILLRLYLDAAVFAWNIAQQHQIWARVGEDRI